MLSRQVMGTPSLFEWYLVASRPAMSRPCPGYGSGRASCVFLAQPWVRSFGMIENHSDRRGKRSERRLYSQTRCFKGTTESTLVKDSVILLIHHDPSDLG